MWRNRDLFVDLAYHCILYTILSEHLFFYILFDRQTLAFIMVQNLSFIFLSQTIQGFVLIDYAPAQSHCVTIIYITTKFAHRCSSLQAISHQPLAQVVFILSTRSVCGFRLLLCAIQIKGPRIMHKIIPSSSIYLYSDSVLA